ncbi:DUF1045 domain-containing protein [Kiloniella antarctica]|uniref:DUF1045 domain-containing protein n=1 Tax=Kiloniella antarctica TaxID=1550907 RepID=A0ABW5BNQ1_9PROT
MMTHFKRFAIYYAPPRGSDLEAFGESWFEWNSQQVAPRIQCSDTLDLSNDEIKRITYGPARYKFHGTLKPPFYLNSDFSLDDLDAALFDLARAHKAFECGALQLTEIGQFLALCPVDTAQNITKLASACVEEIDRFRKPETQGEMQRRRDAGLTPHQDDLLVKWGYPYVMDEFRFHLTLTGRMDKELHFRAKKSLTFYFKNLLQQNFPFKEIALFGDPGEGRKFQEIERYKLSV